MLIACAAQSECTDENSPVTVLEFSMKLHVLNRKYEAIHEKENEKEEEKKKKKKD